ncbi:alpha/beta hydrolase [Yoonia sp. GPGPB17]|uniref:alpha/beta hydrolase n=1 Tax=Yoonia sp. GPGPB17 TaxID=3026147 RepID=UPI0030BCC1CA
MTKAMQRRTIVLIHGFGCGGDVWDKMKAALQDHSWPCLAPTLCDADRPLNFPPQEAAQIGLNEYLADARKLCLQVENETGRKPVVIGHSMGGLIAQALAAEGRCSHAVLIAPAPPRAVKNLSLWQLWLYANVLLTGKRNRYHKAWRCGVETVLLNRVPPFQRDRIHAKLRYEPGHLFSDMMKGVDIPRYGIQVPLLVIAGGRDRIIPARVVHKTVEHYRHKSVEHYRHKSVACDELYYGTRGHWIIDEPGNQQFISDVIAWLEGADS